MHCHAVLQAVLLTITVLIFFQVRQFGALPLASTPAARAARHADPSHGDGTFVDLWKSWGTTRRQNLAGVGFRVFPKKNRLNFQAAADPPAGDAAAANPLAGLLGAGVPPAGDAAAANPLAGILGAGIPAAGVAAAGDPAVGDPAGAGATGGAAGGAAGGATGGATGGAAGAGVAEGGAAGGGAAGGGAAGGGAAGGGAAGGGAAGGGAPGGGAPGGGAAGGGAAGGGAAGTGAAGGGAAGGGAAGGGAAGGGAAGTGAAGGGAPGGGAAGGSAPGGGAAGGGTKAAELTVSIPRFQENEFGKMEYNPWGATYGVQFMDTRFRKNNRPRVTIALNPVKNYYPSVDLTTVCIDRTTIYNNEKVERWLMRSLTSKKRTNRPFSDSLRREIFNKAQSESCHNSNYNDWMKYQECALRRNQRMEYFVPKYPLHQVVSN